MKINTKLLSVALQDANPTEASFSGDRIQERSQEVAQAAQEYYACKWYGFDDEDKATLAIASLLTERSPLEVIRATDSKNFLNPIIVRIKTEYLGGPTYRIYPESGEAIPTAILREFAAQQWPHHTVSYFLNLPYLPTIKSEYDVFASAVPTDDLLEPDEYESNRTTKPSKPSLRHTRRLAKYQTTNSLWTVYISSSHLTRNNGIQASPF